MKRILLFASIVLATTHVSAQDLSNFQFGVKGGLSNLSVKVPDQSASELGFYLGALAEFGINEDFSVQPEILYAAVNGANSLYVPIMANYHAMEGLRIQAGPQINVLLGDYEGMDFNSLGIDLAFGGAYDINENFFVDARYGLELTNRYTGEMDMNITFNTFQVGAGYRF